MTQRPALLALSFAAILAAAACNKPDEAALAKSDAALRGQVVDGQLAAVATRAVMTGSDGPRAPACAATMAARERSVTVRWSASAAGPAKAEAAGNVAVCERDGGWAGIVFPAHGQDLSDCLVATPIRSEREYQGPCRWGWVEASALVASTD